MLRAGGQDDIDRLQSATFSNGWLHRFQKRNNLKSRRVYGEAASASEEAVNNGRAQLIEVTRGYEKRNIFNLDETAYFYCMAQTKTICTSRIPGRKKIKKRITVAVTSNADGSCRWPLLFIGTSKQPRCFGQRSPDDLDVDYEATMKGWMTSIVFSQWIEKFNSRMQNEERHVLLLLDNASPHRYDQELSHVTVRMPS
ncbi:hypothetical protein AeRB84_004881 [Aphanomyces euteiches]|nr:hypothetical protein AeRB84_004881 [Aphanomyces euteiches]